MILLEGRIKFKSISEMLRWRAENAPRMVLVGSGRNYSLSCASTRSKAPSSSSSRPLRAQKSL